MLTHKKITMNTLTMLATFMGLQKSIKKHIGMYFSDCPGLVSKITKDNSLKIVEYYDKKCSIK